MADGGWIGDPEMTPDDGWVQAPSGFVRRMEPREYGEDLKITELRRSLANKAESTYASDKVRALLAAHDRMVFQLYHVRMTGRL